MLKRKKDANLFRKALKELEQNGMAVIICDHGRYALREKGGSVVKDGYTREEIERFSYIAEQDRREPVLH